MLSERILTGTIAVSGKVKGEALVSHHPLTFMGGVDTEKGTFNDLLYPELKGLTMAQRILIYPFNKGSTGDSIRLWRCVQNDVGPSGIINAVADPILVQGSIIANIPMVYNIDISTLNSIKTGDLVEIDGDKVIIFKR